MKAKDLIDLRYPYLEQLASLYVDDYVTFAHMLHGKVSKKVMQGRGDGVKKNALAMALNASKMVEAFAPSQKTLHSIYQNTISAQAAVCTTFACSAAYVLATPDGPRVEIISHNAKKGWQGTHLFVVVGRDGDELKSGDWIADKDCYIVDAWAASLGWDLVFQASSFGISPIAKESNRLRQVVDCSEIDNLADPILQGLPVVKKKKKKKFKCYITTATCDSLGLGDDCDELMILREYRDQILSRTDEGRRDIERYYALAPAIVDAIDERRDAADIYARIYAESIAPSVDAVLAGEHDEAHSLFKSMVLEMQARFLGD